MALSHAATHGARSPPPPPTLGFIYAHATPLHFAAHGVPVNAFSRTGKDRPAKRCMSAHVRCGRVVSSGAHIRPHIRVF